jgi:hypothetical protein
VVDKDTLGRWNLMQAREMLQRRCKSCRFWDKEIQVCKRHAPVADPARQLTRVWPEMPANGWCGDFEARHAPTS